MNNEQQGSKPTNPLGTYVDPESGASEIAQHEAQADAFVHLGWKLQAEKPVDEPLTKEK